MRAGGLVRNGGYAIASWAAVFGIGAAGLLAFYWSVYRADTAQLQGEHWSQYERQRVQSFAGDFAAGLGHLEAVTFVDRPVGSDIAARVTVEVSSWNRRNAGSLAQRAIQSTIAAGWPGDRQECLEGVAGGSWTCVIDCGSDLTVNERWVRLTGYRSSWPWS